MNELLNYHGMLKNIAILDYNLLVRIINNNYHQILLSFLIMMSYLIKNSSCSFNNLLEKKLSISSMSF